MRFYNVDMGRIIVIIMALACIIISLSIYNQKKYMEKKKCAEEELTKFIIGQVKKVNFDKCSSIE